MRLRAGLVAENLLLWGAYHLLMWARMFDLAEAVARRCVERHGLPGDYVDLIGALHAQGKDDEAEAWLQTFERKNPAWRRWFRTARIRSHLKTSAPS